MASLILGLRQPDSAPTLHVRDGRSDSPEDFMSDSNPTAHDATHGDHEVHEGPIKTPKQLIWAVVAAFVVPIIIIIMLTRYVSNGNQPAAGSDGLGAEATARRLQPIGSIELRDASAPVVLRTGEQVYQGQCSACHGTGAAGAQAG
jgi:hypothetical protein